MTRIAHEVTKYLLADPITFDRELKQEFNDSNPALLLLRVIGSQFPYHVNKFEALGRSLLLFEEIPRALRDQSVMPDFDLEARFRAVSGGLRISQFVKLGFVAWCFSQHPAGLTNRVLEECQRRGLKVGTATEIRVAFQLLSSSVEGFRELYARSNRQSDVRFGMYEFNPLHVSPLIRPWGHEPFWSERGGRMIAPVPDLIISRVSLGIYHQLLTAYGTEFSQYFGHVFAEYCGYLIRAAGRGSVLTEDEIRKRYPSTKGRKAPDWVIVDGNTAILIECKATRFTRAAIQTGSAATVNDSLKQVRKGLKQLYQFREACRAGAAGLEALHHCTEYVPVVLTLEPYYAVNSPFFRDELDAVLRAEGVANLSWRLVAMEELELIERYVRGGISWTEALTTSPTSEVIEDYKARTGMNRNEDSCLSPKYKELLGHLGLG